jgi:hypothetical protein
MQGLFPKTPFIPVALHETIPVCEWIMPAQVSSPRDLYSTCKVLPPGSPDCLRVEISHSGEGTERCTAAIYGGRAYVIHYEFKANRSA